MPRESKADKKTRTAKIIRKLKRKYPDARTALNYANPLELLVATILSAQCTDKKINEVTPDVFARYRTAEDFANADAEELQQAIRATGFYRNKAKSIRKACAQLVEQHDGAVPQSMDELVALPGVARKTAAVVLGNAFGINEGIPVDTHVSRLAARMKLTYHKKPRTDKIERDLMALVPQKDWATFAHLLTWHGRGTCTARAPDCDNCVVSELCPSAFKV